MTETVPETERTQGYVGVGPGRVWYEIAGDGPETIVLLHGGPGASSDYLEAFMDLADVGYRVVRYEQLGSRRSDKPDDPSLWQVPRFVDELETVRRELGLETMHLLGQSWGVFLAIEYALHHQERLRSLILYSGAASTAECVAGMQRLRSELPREDQEILARYEATGETGDPVYFAIIQKLYQRHLCRIQPEPPALAESGRHLSLPVYHTMWGANEFFCTGTLRDWDRTDRLEEINVPTLITNGRYDEVVPECGETLHRGISGSQLVIFEESSHSAHLEEPDLYFAVLHNFLESVKAQD
jgi:proline-specific peptidase